jgi:hypothetical protein
LGRNGYKIYRMEREGKEKGGTRVCEGRRGKKKMGGPIKGIGKGK